MVWRGVVTEVSAESVTVEFEEPITGPREIECGKEIAASLRVGERIVYWPVWEIGRALDAPILPPTTLKVRERLAAERNLSPDEIALVEADLENERRNKWHRAKYQAEVMRLAREQAEREERDN